MLALASAGCSSSGGGASGPGPGGTATGGTAMGGAGGTTSFQAGTGLISLGSAGTQTSRIGSNGTRLVERADNAMFATTIGNRDVNVTLPRTGGQVLEAGDPRNPLGTRATLTVYETESGDFLDGTRREESLAVVDTRYASLIAYDLSVGFETTRSAVAVGPADADTPRGVPTAGTATYSGIATGGSVNELGGSEEFEGTLSLRADFGAGTVGGRLDDDTSDRAILLEDGRISGADYSGTARVVEGTTQIVTSDGPGDRSRFAGGFFGPRADETAGLVEVTGTQNGVDVEVLGAFLGVKD